MIGPVLPSGSPTRWGNPGQTFSLSPALTLAAPVRGGPRCSPGAAGADSPAPTEGALPAQRSKVPISTPLASSLPTTA